MMLELCLYGLHPQGCGFAGGLKRSFSGSRNMTIHERRCLAQFLSWKEELWLFHVTLCFCRAYAFLKAGLNREKKEFTATHGDEVRPMAAANRIIMMSGAGGHPKETVLQSIIRPSSWLRRSLSENSVVGPRVSHFFGWQRRRSRRCWFYRRCSRMQPGGRRAARSQIGFSDRLLVRYSIRFTARHTVVIPCWSWSCSCSAQRCS